MDGNQHWTLAGVQTWWRRRPELLAELHHDLQTRQRQTTPELNYMRALEAFIAYLEREVGLYLARYMFCIEHGRRPQPGDRLPTLAGV